LRAIPGTINVLRLSTITILLACIPALSPAADHEHGTGSAGPEKLGQVQFENSCAPHAQADFDRAVALLHSFEFGPAMAGFSTILSEDTSCAMAHWGTALGYWGNPFGGVRSDAALQQGFSAIEKARAANPATARELAYVEAAATLFDDYENVTQRERVLAYARAMEHVSREYPDDTEAQIFYALALNQTALPTDKTYAPQLKAASILEPLVVKLPDHPGLTHYIIHAYDHPPLAFRALAAARRYAMIAPSAPHALHMPSHTFTRVGSWDESAATNRRSEHMAIEQGAMTEALHAMDYQTYAYLQMAQYRKAKSVLDRLPDVVVKFDPAGIGGAAPPMAGYFAMTAMPARYALERGAWREAARSTVPEEGTPFTIAMAHFARAIGAARVGEPETAKPDLQRLAELRDELRAGENLYWAEQVDIQRQVASAWVAFAKGQESEAIKLLQAAAEAEDASDKSAVTPGPLAPARELLGYMLLEAGKPEAALGQFEQSMKKEPGRFRGAYGAAVAAEAGGHQEKARRYFALLLEIARDADTPLPELVQAREYIAGTGITSESG
jgi:tetratricopeptide (TPR) repeat protein